MEDLIQIELLKKIKTVTHGITHKNTPAELKKYWEEKISRAKQTHSNSLIWISSPETAIQEADAIATFTANLGVGVFTADCAPLLIVALDKNHFAQAVMAIHAGWKGAANEIARLSFREFVSKTQCSSFLAAIGPTIGFEKFEVGKEVVDLFPGILLRCNAKHLRFEDGKEKFLLNLPAENERQLSDEAKALGVSLEVVNSALCTHTLAEQFPSYRRDKGTTGRILSFISFSK